MSFFPVWAPEVVSGSASSGFLKAWKYYLSLVYARYYLQTIQTYFSSKDIQVVSVEAIADLASGFPLCQFGILL